jgi:hypothetical protein
VAGNQVAAVFSSMLAVMLWVGSILLLRLTPLTGVAFWLASFGLTLGVGLLGWSVLALWERHRRGGGRPAG